MQYCAHCQAPYQGGKFCGNCGNVFEPLEVNEDQQPVASDSPTKREPEPGIETSDLGSSADHNHQQQPYNQVPPHQPSYAAASTVNNNYQRSSTSIQESGKNYFNNLKDVCKRPMEAVRKASDQNYFNAKVTFALFVILSGLLVYLAAQKMEDIFSILSFGFDVPFWSVFIPVAIVSIITLLAICLTLFLILKINNPAAPAFKDVAGRFATLLAYPMIAMALSCLFLLIEVTSIAFYTNVLTFFGIVAAIPFTIVSFHQGTRGGLDAFLQTILSYFILFLVLRMVILHIISSITDMFMPF
ncbi:hypothetical protein [Thalassobacillus hwangdonensis]|uniref:Yip1 domain-containing protein n=1 Tax=Thalassobacillus hwangdonensis TaxID=546108 RepID=A0ABW3L2S3_9BACI